MPGQIKIPKQRSSEENRAERAALETRPYRATPAQSEQKQVNEDNEAKVAPAVSKDESELDATTDDLLDELNEILQENDLLMLGEVALALHHEQERQEFETWRVAYLGKTGVAA